MMRNMHVDLGIAIPVQIETVRRIIDGEAELDLPTEAKNVVTLLADHFLQLHAKLRKMDLRLAVLQRSEERARRQATILGIGPISATALTSSVIDPSQFAA